MCLMYAHYGIPEVPFEEESATQPNNEGTSDTQLNVQSNLNIENSSALEEEDQEEHSVLGTRASSDTTGWRFSVEPTMIGIGFFLIVLAILLWIFASMVYMLVRYASKLLGRGLMATRLVGDLFVRMRGS